MNTRKIVPTIGLALCLALGSLAAATGIQLFAPQERGVVEQAHAATKATKGCYKYTYSKSSGSGYALYLTVKKVKNGWATMTLDQSYWWPPCGGAVISSKTIKAKVRSNKASFKFKTYGGDACKAWVKFYSKKTVKVSIKC